MRETITIQVGQCGNQIGAEFWSKLSQEHGLTNNGVLHTNMVHDRKDLFFYETDCGKFVPRSVLVDLEPRVISDLKSTFTFENVFIDAMGGGAGNNWAHGYAKGNEFQNEIVDLIQREAEACDDMESFILLHSIAGGTGSGLGSLLLENLKEYFPKKIIQTYSIFPNNEEVSDVVVQPYNSLLTLQRLSLCADSVFVIDNTALNKINNNLMQCNRSTLCDSYPMNFSMINNLIGTVIAASTSTLRFPTYMYSDLTSLNSVLVPVDRLKFIVPSYTPFTLNNRLNRRTDCQDIIRKLLLPHSSLASVNNTNTDKIISMVNILQGVKCEDIQKSIYYAFDRGNLNFVKWMPPSFHIVRNAHGTEKTGLSMNNSTSVCGLFKKITEQFDMLKKKNAFVERYKEFNSDLSEFTECREVMQSLIDAYENV